MAHIFDFAPVALRSDLHSALNSTHELLGQAGDWLHGKQRLAVVAETRHAWDCSLCNLQKSEITPYAVRGEHQALGELPNSWVDVIHRVVTDPGRLSERWFQEALSNGMEEDEFIEVISVSVQALAIDIFAGSIGMEVPPPTKTQGWSATKATAFRGQEGSRLGFHNCARGCWAQFCRFLRQ